DALIDRTLRQLSARAPLRAVRRREHRKLEVLGERQRVAREDAVALKAFWILERPIVAFDRHREPRRPRELGRAGDAEHAQLVEAAPGGGEHALVERAARSKIDRARGVEVAELRVV